MSGESISKKKWWHGSLFIKKRENGEVVCSLSSQNAVSPAINYLPSTIVAYGDFNTPCYLPVSIPVPAFDPNASPGYFLFRPTLEDLEECIVDIATYQEAINLNKRYIFEFKRTAAYDVFDTECDSVSPTALDSFTYATITNSLNSNVFRFPEMPLYSQIGCCQVELSVPSSDLPVLSVNENPTRIWYLTYSSVTSKYTLYSYDFGLISNALVNRGEIDTSNVGSLFKIYDITWIPVDNSLLAICDDGVRRLFPGDASNKAILGNRLGIKNLPPNNVMFPIPADIADSYKSTIEYNVYDNFLYVFSALEVTPDGGSAVVYPTLFRFSYERNALTLDKSAALFSLINEDSFTIGGIAFSNINNKIYCIINNNLSILQVTGDFDFGNFTSVSTTSLLGGITALGFSRNNDSLLSEDVLYAGNGGGQIFSINTVDGSSINLGINIGSSIIGAGTTINGEDTRIQLFPFLIGSSHWLFMIDISATMAGNRLSIIKEGLINFLRNFVRYGDQISILWFRDSYAKITKTLKTYSDVNEVINYIETYFIPSSNITNFCGPFSNISQNFTDLKNIFIFSDGTFDDCSIAWQSVLSQSIDAIRAANNGVNFTTVGVKINSGAEKLQHIATYSGGTYINW